MSSKGIDVLLTTGRTLAQGRTMELGKNSKGYQDAVSVCEIDRSTLELLGIKEGDPVRVATSEGSVVVFSKVDPRGRAGIVFIPVGPYSNAVIPSRTGGTGMPGFKAVRASLTAALDSPVLPLDQLLRGFTQR